MNRLTGPIYEFGAFRLDFGERVLRCAGKPVQLTPKALEVLLLLIENSGRIVESNTLMNKVWRDSFVEENNLKVTISMLRKTLGKADDQRDYIETVPRRGYRFIAEVREVVEEETKAILSVRTESPATGPRVKTIALLPFKFLSPAFADEYLGLGMADTLITRLSNIKQLIVRPTSSVLKYADTAEDPLTIGRDLQVETILEGSIRRTADRVRVTVRLLNTSDGASLWGDKFDENFTDIFAVEDIISERVAAALVSKLTDEEKSSLTKRYTQSSEAYKAYLQGRYYAHHLTRTGFNTAIECLGKALEIDPEFALAYEGLAYNYVQALDIFLSPAQALGKARQAVEKALQIDDTIAEAHATLGSILFWHDWDWAAAEREFLRAIELNPNAASPRQLYGWFLIFMQRFDEAFAQLELGRQFNPTSLEGDLYYGPSFYFSRQYDRAVDHFQKIIPTYPSHWLSRVILGRAYEQKGLLQEALAQYQDAANLEKQVPEIFMDLGRVYGLMGRRKEALQVMNDLQTFAQQDYVPPFCFAMIHLGLGEWDEVFAYLEKAYESRSWYMTWLKIVPELDALRSDSRYRDLMRRVGFS
jgi:DNA-binding winged helix-turn-helix (wHTH) protein/tetratricopeptide (TPR) repeat protein